MIFVDTGVWFEAAAREGSPADSARAALRAAHGQLATSDAVLAELWNLLQRFGHVHLATPTCADIAVTATMLSIDDDVRRQILGLQRAWYDQRFSYTDASSFVLMEHHGIDTVLSFDPHFRAYRAGPHRSRAWRVLPE
ncbi:MAG: type II toxin-antitoxin system VapC family toxin [Egibacteraceae bacterium]